MKRVSTPVRAGSTFVAVAGAVALAGCSAASEPVVASVSPSADSPAGAADVPAVGSYRDGTYTASGSYQTPESVETIDVTLTLGDGVITAVQVTGDPQKRESEQYQGQFISGIGAEVVVKKIDELDVTRVAGSSLTSSGFNAAVAQIAQDAAA